jgi:hypothetical protein
VYLIGIAVYALALGVVMFFRGGFIGPDTFLIFLVLLVVVLGQTRSFLRDWTPFVILLFAWQMLRGYADNVGAGNGFPLHNADLVAAERWLFGGHIPSVVLQRALYDPPRLHWYDVAATFFWAFHFVLALGFAFLLWVRSRSLYWRFVYALLLLSTMGIITYVVFPAVPPWMASNPPPWLASRVAKTIPEQVHLLRAEVPYYLGLRHLNWSWIMSNGNPNETAAMPSLHAAYPALIFVFSLVYWRRVAPLALIYCLCLWFSIVYMGDHYVIDALAGIIYAVVAFFALEWVHGWIGRRRVERRTGAVAEEAS